MTAQAQPGKLINLRGRDWVVLPSDGAEDLLVIKPLGGSDDEITGIYLPLDLREEKPADARFPNPTAAVCNPAAFEGVEFHLCFPIQIPFTSKEQRNET